MPGSLQRYQAVPWRLFSCEDHLRLPAATLTEELQVSTDHWPLLSAVDRNKCDGRLLLYRLDSLPNNPKKSTARMDNTKNYYGTLGVLPTAEPIVIRAAYRALAMKYHPDKWTGDKATAERRMREINQAYEILSDERSRARYDRQKKDTNATNYAFRGAEQERRPDWWCRPGTRKA